MSTRFRSNNSVSYEPSKGPSKIGKNVGDFSGIGTPQKHASKVGCVFCDNLTQGKQYSGKLHEYRTNDGRTIPWTDPSSGIRLTRTMDFITDTGEVFTGGEITHGKRAHDNVLNSKNLIAFTIVSTGLKRYVLTQSIPKTQTILKIENNHSITTEEITRNISAIDNIYDIENMLKLLATALPPKRFMQVANKIKRNPKIANLLKQSKHYTCEICERAPFIQRNGKPYAEADHIKPLGGKYVGLDTPGNMRCLCAQCHAVITHGSSEEIRKLLHSSKWKS